MPRLLRSTGSEAARLKILRTESHVSAQWANASFMHYLHLIDYEGRANAMDVIPWCCVPFSQQGIERYCALNAFQAYKPYIMEKLSTCESVIIPMLLKKLLHVCELLNIFSDNEEIVSLYFDVLNCLYDRCYEEPSLFKSIWNKVCVTNFVKTAIFEKLMVKSPKYNSPRFLKYVLEIANSANFDLHSFPFCPVTSALLNGNSEYMRILLQYGFEQNAQRLTVYNKYFLPCANPLYDLLKSPLETRTSSRTAVITEILLLLIIIVSCKSIRKRLSIVDCFRLLWNSLSYPFITEQELQNEVCKYFTCYNMCNLQRSYPANAEQFFRLVELYSEMLPESENILQPRTLKHLCRCVVRRQLKKAWNLPHGIQSLPVPNFIRSYLILK
ncbi:hypothetical protein X975_27215, partial [Stegodyphus mimosarum]